MEVDSQASLITAERRPIGAGLLLPTDSVRRTEAAVYQASLATQRAVSETTPPFYVRWFRRHPTQIATAAQRRRSRRI